MKSGIPGLSTTDLVQNIEQAPNGKTIIDLIGELEGGNPPQRTPEATRTLIGGLNHPETRGIVLGTLFDQASRSTQHLALLQDMLGEHSGKYLNAATRAQLISIAGTADHKSRTQTLGNLVKQRINQIGDLRQLDTANAVLPGGGGREPPSDGGPAVAALGGDDPIKRFQALLGRTQVPEQRAEAMRELTASLKDPAQRNGVAQQFLAMLQDPAQYNLAMQALVAIGSPAARALQKLSTNAERQALLDPVIDAIRSGKQSGGSGARAGFSYAEKTGNLSDYVGAADTQPALPSVAALIDTTLSANASTSSVMSTLNGWIQSVGRGENPTPLFCEILMRTR
jgi:hypothetical protein